MRILDADSHLFERPELWRDYADPGRRDAALSIENDELGHPFLIHRGRPLCLTWTSTPGSFESIGDLIEDHRAGRPSTYDYGRDLPESHWSPSARRDFVAECGIETSVCFPQWGINWELWLRDDLEGLRTNMSAWNRWAADVRAEGKGRLHPVGHVTLQDPDWLDGELAALSRAGIRLAMISTGLVAGRRLSHRDHDRAWASFVRHGVTPTFHVGGPGLTGVLEPGWIDNDDLDYMPMLSFPMHGTDAQLALADMVLNGVFQRHPELRLAVVELLSRWLPDLFFKLDGAYDTHRRISGHQVHQLEMLPSEYLRRHVRVGAFASERPGAIMDQVGPMLMFGGDFPHPEGFDSPLADYEARMGRALPAEQAEPFFGGNLAELVGA